jgi:uncharacterized protein (DUF58 family)
VLVALDGRSPLSGLFVADEFSAGRTRGGSTFYVPVLLPGQQLRCAYDAACTAPRGWQSLSRAVLTLEDPLGLVSLEVVRKLPGEILVLPVARPLDEARVLNPACRTGAEDHGAQEAGAGEEFSGTREYRPGDRFRDIHWRSSAKTGELVVRENARVVRPELCVVLHFHRPAPWGRRSGSGLSLFTVGGWRVSLPKGPSSGPLLSAQALELCIEAAASLVEWGPEAGYRTTLFLAALQPSVLEGIQSREQVLGALRELAVAEPQSTGQLETLLGSVQSRIAPGSVVVLVAPAASVASVEARAALAGLQARGTRVQAVLCLPEPDAAAWPDPSEELASAGIGCRLVAVQDDIRSALGLPAR